MFMWPMLVFGYENFMMLCLLPEFERIMDEFAEINPERWRLPSVYQRPRYMRLGVALRF